LLGLLQQYDQRIKYATALRIGIDDADAILRRFMRSNLQHLTYQRLCELGRAIKTFFLCEYRSSQRLRKEIQEALNVIEQ
jgi:TnpA family transposase